METKEEFEKINKMARFNVSVILDVSKELKKLAKLGLLTKNTIKSYIKMHCRKEKIPTSIVGEELMSLEVEGLLGMWKNYYKVCRDIKKTQDKIDKGDSKVDGEEEAIKIETLEEVKRDLALAITSQEDELVRYKEIQEKYNDNIEVEE